MAISEQKPMPDEDVPIQQVQRAKLRQHGNRSVVVAITEAVEVAGRADGGSFRFDPAAYDELGMVPALGSPEEVDGRRSEHELARNVRKEGAGTLRIVLPEAVLDTLGFEFDEIDWENPPEVSVWAGPDLLAFGAPEERTVSIDRDLDDQEDDENGGE